MNNKADDYSKMCDSKNLERAYRWTQSNPNPEYKNYFRDVYEAYAASSGHNLKRLRKHLIRKAYEPSHASKVFLPKPSGILRPYTLLTVNDQIVYQACINIIAEKLFPKVRQNYLKKTFGNLYAGKTSIFFYRKWQDGYRSFSQHIRDYINGGFRYVANFDLTSFYDSIDHDVLNYFLLELSIDYELIKFLLKCLKVWTSSTWDNSSNAIYHGHGIPQGPLASGLLSELVLKYIDGDNNYNKKSKIQYIRYVDDIKLFAQSEKFLRYKLVGLDLSAKKIGLFPQSSKINIREVLDPSEEIKTISLPQETEMLFSKANQKKLQKKLLELVKNKQVKSKNNTIFKRIIGQVEPTHLLNIRLVNLLIRQPEFFSQIALYFSRYKKLPQKPAKLLFNYIKENEIYHTVHGKILFATLNNMYGIERSKCADFCYNRLIGNINNKFSMPQPIYKAALIAWCLENNKLNYDELRKILNDEMNWWVKKDVLKYIKKHIHGNASYTHLLNEIIKESNEESARVAAYKMIVENINLNSACKEAQESARLLLFSTGKIRNIGPPISLVGTTLDYVLGNKNKDFSDFNWYKFFGAKHKNVEIIAIEIKASRESNINDCIVKLDSLCDLIWELIFIKELPQKTYGNYGSMLKNKNLVTKYNIAAQGFLDLHKLRLESITAHPRNLKTGLPTRILKYYDFNKIRPSIYNAVKEIIEAVQN